MYDVDLGLVRNWGSISEGADTYWFPGSVSLNCPSCTERGIFSLISHVVDKLRHTVASTGACPACNVLAYFWAVNAARQQQRQQNSCQVLLMYPAPHQPRQPIKGTELMPPRIQRAYQEALMAFNASIWSATTTGSRRTLEGIVGDLMPQSRGSLFNRLQQLLQTTNLNEPLINLTDAVRQGGNLGAHFDLDRDPDRETAQATLDLIEYFLEYVYILPGMVRELNERITGLESNT